MAGGTNKPRVLQHQRSKSKYFPVRVPCPLPQPRGYPGALWVLETRWLSPERGYWLTTGEELQVGNQGAGLSGFSSPVHAASLLPAPGSALRLRARCAPAWGRPPPAPKCPRRRRGSLLGLVVLLPGLLTAAHLQSCSCPLLWGRGRGKWSPHPPCVGRRARCVPWLRPRPVNNPFVAKLNPSIVEEPTRAVSLIPGLFLADRLCVGPL